MRQLRTLTTTVALLAAVALLGCGDGDTPPPPMTMPTPQPAANVQVSGNGDIIIHPSLDPEFIFATEFPMQIRETGGGTALWNFFRLSYFRNGVEIERAERGAGAIRDAGFRDIGPNSTTNATLIIRDNATDFDAVELLLGFIDTRDGSQFQRMLNINSFDGVLLDLTPAALPDGASFAIVQN